MDDAFYYIVWGVLVVPMILLIYTQVRQRVPALALAPLAVHDSLRCAAAAGLGALPHTC